MLEACVTGKEMAEAWFSKPGRTQNVITSWNNGLTYINLSIL